MAGHELLSSAWARRREVGFGYGYLIAEKENIGAHGMKTLLRRRRIWTNLNVECPSDGSGFAASVHR